MKILLLILGAAMFVLGTQDAIRIIVDSNQDSIFSFIPGDVSMYVGLDVTLAVAGALAASNATKMKKPSSKHLS